MIKQQLVVILVESEGKHSQFFECTVGDKSGLFDKRAANFELRLQAVRPY